LFDFLLNRLPLTDMHRIESEKDLLAQIPSPSRRLGVGLGVIVATFLGLAYYTLHEIRWLQDFQVNVVEKCRKDSLQLVRLQGDAYRLAISLREMARNGHPTSNPGWRAEFNRLHADMDDALRLESQLAISMPNMPMSDEERSQLRTTLQNFWSNMSQVFTAADRTQGVTARHRA